MSAAAILKFAVPSVLLVLAPQVAMAQTPGPPPSERAMPDAKTDAPDPKSERALPTQSRNAAPAPAAAERAMPAKEK